MVTFFPPCFCNTEFCRLPHHVTLLSGHTSQPPIHPSTPTDYTPAGCTLRHKFRYRKLESVYVHTWDNIAPKGDPVDLFVVKLDESPVFSVTFGASTDDDGSL